MLKMKLFPKAILIAALSVSMFTVSPLSASEFGDTYKAYTAAVAADNSADIELYALKAYQLGKQKFAADSLDIAMLALNGADALIHNLPPNTYTEENAAKAKVLKQQAFELYKVALVNYKEHYTDEAVELIDPLMGLADSSSKKDAREYLDDALDIAEKSGNAMLLADTQMGYFKVLSASRYYTRTVRNHVLNAYEAYQKLLPENSMKRVQTAFTVGSIEYAEKHFDKAETALLYVIEQFEALEFDHPYELAAHAKLVEIYEIQGESEKSTQHCIAIGSMKPWNAQQEQTPLFRKEPMYPMSYLQRRKEGWSQISFTVNEMGFVVNPVILASKGGSGFNKASLEALKKWRYAPKFVDGKAVAAESSVQLDYTIQ
ncbi:energy transducer TonB [Shewanella sp. KX20019]|uniref:energy transducer TonB n=1 Tax=Shewanella sp. KX20019 TaxID=2803864 RepID=UPI001927F10D|nr:energy transducer TonB [Shewanella sp. KX20019]QQX79131.1 energy transducer TonB [Shewanella sp. KX20019]